VSSSPKTGARGALGVIFLIVFLDLMGMGVLIPVLPFVVQPFRADALTVGLISLAYSAAQFLAAPLLGVWSDRAGRRPVLLLCLFGGGVGYFLFGLGHSLTLLFLARALSGFMGGSISTAQAYIADISAPSERSKNFGLIGAAFGLGFILGPALGGALSKVSLSAPAYASAVLSMVTLAVASVLLKESLPAERRARGAFAWSSLNPLGQIGAALARPLFRDLLLAVFLLNFAMAGLSTNFAVFTHARFGLDAAHNAILFAFLGVMAAVTQGGLLRKLAPRFGEPALVEWGSALFVIGFVLLAASANLGTVYASVAFTALGFGLATPSLSGMISMRASAGEQGALLGTVQAVASLTRVVGPVWAGALFDHVGQGAPYWAGAVIALAALGFTVVASRRARA